MTRSATVVLVLGAATGVAAAQDRGDVPPPDATAEPALRGWAITPYVGTVLGLGAGFGVEAETPIRIRIDGGVGFLPTSYAWAARELYDATHDDREAVGRLIEELTEFSLVTGGHITYRPWARRGFYFGVGYTLQWAEKSGLFAAQFEVATDVMVPPSDRVLGRRFTVNETLHFLNAVLGWQWGLGEGFTFRAALGFAKVVHASTDLEPEFMPLDGAATAAFQTAVERRLEDDGDDYYAPSVSFYLGYNFR